ncbi:MAG: biotin-dependent carboxyltransferase family protein [Candidatus Dormibacteraceae bacterium]
MSPLLRVEAPGLLTTIQDLGRPGHRAAGVSPGGAMDRFALMAGNRLVGNEAGAPALECTLRGPTLVTSRGCLVAITGGDLEPRVNGVPVPMWESFMLGPGDRLAFGTRRAGARAYVAVGGGLAAQRWLGSASTYLLVGRGGFQGRVLGAGDELEIALEPTGPRIAGRRLPVELRPRYGPGSRLMAIAGPHADRLAEGAGADLFGGHFTVARDADRMGYRLEGPRLRWRGQELVSMGVTAGCVQVPPSGEPILLMADHQTAGGYPVVACLGACSLPAAAQLLPGDGLELEKVPVATAQSEWRRLLAGLETLT